MDVTNRCILAFVGAMLSLNSFGQETSMEDGRSFSFRSLKEVRIYINAGVNGQLPVGNAVNHFKDEIKLFDKEDPTTNFSGKTQGYIGPVARIKVGYSIKKFEFGTGIQYRRLGTDFKASFAFHDPEFQRDELGQYHAKLRVSVLEIPFWVHYFLNDNLSVGGGFIGGIPIGGAAEINARYDIILNGERDEEYSLPEEYYEADIKEVTKGFYSGLFLQTTYRLSDKIQLEAEASYIPSYATWPEKSIGAIALSLGGAYRIR